jgi:hypothetical protein
MAWFLGDSRNFRFDSFFPMNGVLLLMAWSAVWTGLALWHAAKRGEKWWFIIFLLVHTAGIAEILYLVFVAKAFAKSTSAKKKKK